MAPWTLASLNRLGAGDGPALPSRRGTVPRLSPGQVQLGKGGLHGELSGRTHLHPPRLDVPAPQLSSPLGTGCPPRMSQLRGAWVA